MTATEEPVKTETFDYQQRSEASRPESARKSWLGPKKKLPKALELDLEVGRKSKNESRFLPSFSFSADFDLSHASLSLTLSQSLYMYLSLSPSQSLSLSLCYQSLALLSNFLCLRLALCLSVSDFVIRLAT